MTLFRVNLFGAALLSVAQGVVGQTDRGANSEATASAGSGEAADRAMQRSVVAHHAAFCHHVYAEVERLARLLETRVGELIDEPSSERLAAARQAWLKAREVYGMTEAMRFHDGPIEPLEPLINAWPIDEAYIDYVVGRPDAGMIGNVQRFPSLDAALLELANERGGEANICVGWHAIEFMLWGQDLSEHGPGDRPYTDFVPGEHKHGARRGQYLRAVTGLLVRHLHQLTQSWAPGAPYRLRFEREVDKSIRRILIGVTVLTAFELGGERLVVAYETRDQEQEHSCFSDNTWQDFVSNQLGLRRIVLGCEFEGSPGPGIVELVRHSHPAAAAALEAAIGETERALRAIPRPFDRAFLGDDDAPGRRAMAAAITALDQQTEALLIVGKLLGHDLPLAPGG